LARLEHCVDLLQRVGQPLLPVAQVVLARVVGAVGQPQLQVGGAGLPHDLDALGVVLYGLAADRLVGVRERAELVVVVLEQVRVDAADLHAEVGGVLGELAEVVDLVPRDVQGDPRGDAGVLVHLRRVFELLVGVAGDAGLAEHLEPGAGVAERPRGQLDGLLRQGVHGAGAKVGH
jgi:hypothetical protein